MVEGSVIACGGGNVHRACISIPDTFLWGPFCPFDFLGMLMHSQHPHKCIDGKVVSKQVVQRVLESAIPFWRRPCSYSKCWLPACSLFPQLVLQCRLKLICRSFEGAHSLGITDKASKAGEESKTGIKLHQSYCVCSSKISFFSKKG